MTQKAAINALSAQAGRLTWLIHVHLPPLSLAVTLPSITVAMEMKMSPRSSPRTCTPCAKDTV